MLRKLNITAAIIFVLFTAVLTAEDINIVEISRIENSKEVVHSSDTGGKIIKVLYKNGDFVKKGSVIVELENQQIEAAYKQAETQYILSKITYEKAKEFAKDQQVLNLEKASRGVIAAKMALQKAKKGAKQEQIDQLRLNVETAKANFENIKKNYEKNQVMYNNKLISEQSFLQLKTQYETADNSVKSAEKALDLAMKGTDDEDISSLEAAVKEAEASYNVAKKMVDKEIWSFDIATAESAMNGAKSNFDFAKERFDDLKIKAEFSGMIVGMDLDEGNKMTPGKSLFSIVDADTMELKVGIEEKYVTEIKKNGKAEVFVETLNKKFKGIIAAIAPIGDEKTKKFDAKVKIKNENHQLKAGMHGEVTITIDK